MMTNNGMDGGKAWNSTRFICTGPFTLDLKSHNALINQKQISIPPCTFDCLVTLLRHSPEPVSYKTLVSESFQTKLPELEAQDLARFNIYVLRKALESDVNQPRYVLSVPGYGYRLAF